MYFKGALQGALYKTASKFAGGCSSASRQPPRDEILSADVESGLDGMFERFFDNVFGHIIELRLSAGVLWQRWAV